MISISAALRNPRTRSMMRGNHLLRHLAVAASLLQPALPLPQVGITVAAAPIAWVTVDASGSAQTVTPAVITTEGHLATVSNAPATLVSTATYTLSPSGRASTYTGLAPVASATGTGGSLAGVFPACDGNANVGPIEPFCLPKAGSELHPGTTYYSSHPNPPPFLNKLCRLTDFPAKSNLVPILLLPAIPPPHPPRQLL